MVNKVLAGKVAASILQTLRRFPDMIPVAIPLKGNMRARVVRAVVGISFLALMCFALISLSGMNRLAEIAVRSSSDLGEQTCKISSAAVEDLNTASLVRFTIDQANLCNAQFQEIEATVRRLMLSLVAEFFVAIAAVYLVARKVARLITEPILVLDAGAKVIGAGNLEHRIEVESGDEIEALADTFNRMTENLREYIRSLTETTAAKQKIQGELKVATDIQVSLLPRLFPPFPNRREFDIFAHMDPAKEVGGDFYDFFFVDDRTLCFLIADVSDKGVPAALYMMVAKTLLKTEALRGLGPDEILFRVNNLLADNDSCMFVTVFCALLDTGSGEIRFANAGHNPPLIYRRGVGFDYLNIQAGFVLGPMANSTYVTQTVTLGKDDVLFLYTDGVTEAQNAAAELYGEKRLLAALNWGEVSDLPTMVHTIRKKVAEHAKDAPQSDDVTMLALKFRGGGDV